jgi:hypothetical protein
VPVEDSADLPKLGLFHGDIRLERRRQATLGGSVVICTVHRPSRRADEARSEEIKTAEV